MVVKSAVGGTFELLDLGITFQPGETLDLAFFATNKQLQESRELRLALEKGHLKSTNSTPLVPVNFLALNSKAIPIPNNNSVRRALFVDVSLPQESISYSFYVMRDLPTRRNIVTRTQEAELLRTILANETDKAILATARGRLARLRPVKGEKKNVSR